MVERRVCNAKVAGSTPAISTMTRRTENQRFKHNIRRSARRRSLDKLYALQNSLCWWCKSACVIVANIPESDRLSNSNGFIEWQIGPDRFRAKMATVDHLDGVTSFDSNDEDSLVMACGDCNKDRTRQHKSKIERVCHRCGGPLRPKQKGQCHQCRIDRTIAWFKTNGWEEIQSPDGDKTHTKFRDPQTGADHILRHACEILKGRNIVEP